ncbi:conserved hypothetical protein [Nitrobacter hamburgensis X14]|uniref:Uncharacterized protein n=1 Tax=Nitrobacter hamburgensis (strain DSM 10229 / NCIMB 13809 / X14) TaxID=323097 RepID=Q1QLC5_NITHX|nr:hypothetical protein [Nitrobacter hamburgensis]ABE62972.1 conserved hypothetical protein [Nitrobacter hamburgensis X14]
MANEPNPNDRYRRDPADNDVQPAARLDDKLQPAPELAGRPAGRGRIVLLAIAIAVILGTVFYGLNNSTGPTETSTTAQQSTSPSTAQNNAAKPPVAPGVRDVTPSSTQPDVTTGAAPANSTQQANPQSGNTPTR